MSLPLMRLLSDALLRPETLQRLSPGEWDALIRQARRADLLARIASRAKSAGLWESIPGQPRMHLASALQLALRQHVELRHEVRQIARALEPTGLPVVLLKGAAYTLAGLDAAQGRMVSDVDILVPRERLAEVESALMMAGWISTNRDPYDQRYYRTWMHELPPMRHMQRGTVLDVHHAILPMTARFKPDTARLLQASTPVDGHESVRVLSRVDMVLHSAAHLFHEGELEMGTRGLVDLDALLREFSGDAGFWGDLQARAAVLDLEGPMSLALRYCSMMLGTPVPEALMTGVDRRRGVHSSSLRQRMMDALYLRALRPDHTLTSDRWTPLARFALYLRGHWLRMPAWLLVGHLLRKFFITARRSTSSHETTN